MFTPIKETFKNIFKEKGLFFSSLISLIVVFVLLNTFIFGIFNMNNLRAKIENSNQAIVYVKTMTQDEITNFQAKLVKTYGIKSIKYESKESALEFLEKDLNIKTPKEENPLFDAFYVYIDRKANVSKVSQELVKNNEIVELNMRIEEIEKVNKFSKNFDRVLILTGIGLLIFSLILISNITSFSVKLNKKEISELVEKGVPSIKIKKTFFYVALIQITISSIIAFFLFVQLQKIIVEGLVILKSNLIVDMTIKELQEIFLISFTLGILIIFFVNFVLLNKYYKKRKIIEKEIVES